MTTMLTPELLASFDASVGDVNQSCILPPAIYCSDEFHEFEKEAVFSHDWLCVGRAGRIPEPGDYFTVTIADEPLILVRDKQGAVRALSAVCRHRDMLVADGAGNCSKFTCPYHLWVYDLDGRLLGAPAMERAEGFEKRSFGLPELRVEEWLGFVFVSFDPDIAPLAPSVAKLEDYAKSFDLEHPISPGARASRAFRGTGRSCSRTSTTHTTPTGSTKADTTSARARTPSSRRGPTTTTRSSARTGSPIVTPGSTRRGTR